MKLLTPLCQTSKRRTSKFAQAYPYQITPTSSDVNARYKACLVPPYPNSNWFLSRSNSCAHASYLSQAIVHQRLSENDNETLAKPFWYSIANSNRLLTCRCTNERFHATSIKNEKPVRTCMKRHDTTHRSVHDSTQHYQPYPRDTRGTKQAVRLYDNEWSILRRWWLTSGFLVF